LSVLLFRRKEMSETSQVVLATSEWLIDACDAGSDCGSSVSIVEWYGQLEVTTAWLRVHQT